MDTPFIRRLTLRNYKSIAACQLDLQPLVFLVGPNGSGKSNLLDALAFVADGLRNSLDHAMENRGGFREVRHRAGGTVSIRLDFTLPSGGEGHYAIEISERVGMDYLIVGEECRCRAPGSDAGSESYFHVASGEVIASSVDNPPACMPDSLFLGAMSGHPGFRPVYDALMRMAVYNIHPRQIAEVRAGSARGVLRHEGGNAASVLANLAPGDKSAVRDCLARIIADLDSIETKSIGEREWISFKLQMGRSNDTITFPASQMSDGTLRALGVLLALFQAGKNGHSLLLIGIEEPEAALHPAAAGALLAALMEASRQRQVLATSHSPDLLDNEDIPTESLLAVDVADGKSIIGPVDEASRSALRDRLFTPGELLRANQLAPDPNSLSDVRDERQLNLFELNGK